MSILGVRAERHRTRYGRLYAPADDSVIGRSLRIYGEWAEREIEALSRFITPGRGIVDVGANIGTHAGAFACRFPQSPIMAFEPQPLVFALLAANVVANEWSNVRPVQAALGDTEALIRLAVDYGAIHNAGAVTLAEAQEGAADGTDGTPVVMTTLDRAVGDADIGLIKIDVEGMEGAVLRGARATISRCRPAIFFEVLTSEGLEDCRSALAGEDYTYFWLKTPAYRVDNFNNAQENIWGRGEVGALALPTERSGGVQYERVPAEVSQIPASPPA